MDAIAGMFTTAGTTSAAEGVASQVAGSQIGQDAVTSVGGQSVGSGGFGVDQLFGSSQSIPFVGPIVSIFQAMEDEKAAKARASEIEFDARAETLKGKSQTVSAIRSLNDVQAFNVVAGFASGGGLAGSRGRVIQDVNRDVDTGLVLIRTNAEIKSGALTRKATLLRKQAKFDKRVGVTTGIFRFIGNVVSAA